MLCSLLFSYLCTDDSMALAIPHTRPSLFRIPFYMLWSERTWLTYLHGYIPMADVIWIAGDWQRGLRKLKI